MAELLTLPKMARKLGVTQKWLREQAASGKVPALKAGNRFLFNSEAVQRAICNSAASSLATNE